MSEAPGNRPWKPITPLDVTAVSANGRIAAVDALREAWRAQLEKLAEDDRKKARQRTLRKLAIETGIIERLYDLDWGLTLTLIAEGIARDVVERASGKVDDHTLATLIAQRDSLELVIDFVKQDRRLTPSFLKELHHALTRTQPHYTAVDALGQAVQRALPRGQWKQWPNHVVRPDGTLLEYCPPEHVDSEIDNLCTWYEGLEIQNLHPLIKAAWLHHRFVQIHPFADGNGRVARGLTLLVMQRHQYAPLVVDRFHRAAYVEALDRANDGDLSPLVQLFANLESAALAGELEQPAAAEPTTSRQVAHTLAAQLAARRARADSLQRTALEVRGKAIVADLQHWFREKCQELWEVFGQQGIEDIEISDFTDRSDQPAFQHGMYRHLDLRRQVIESARVAGHHADLSGFVALVNLRIRIEVEGTNLGFHASVHGAGSDSGVLAVTTFATIRQGTRPDQEAPDTEDIPTTADAFRVVYTEPMEAVNDRLGELHELLDQGLAVALAELLKRI
ncbi:MAG TPA: Fic family protein [Kofleriaceae bacterium]|nr:Fic family protein [Kofleriaceae bacterium]